MTGFEALEPNEPPEVVERDLIPARRPLKVAAVDLADAGFEQAAATVAVLGVEPDRDRMAAAFKLAAEACPPEERELAIETIEVVGGTLESNGHEAAATRLGEVWQMARTIWPNEG